MIDHTIMQRQMHQGLQTAAPSRGGARVAREGGQLTSTPPTSATPKHHETDEEKPLS